MQISAADQPDKSVAQVLPLQQHKYHKHDDDAGGRQWLYQGTDDCLQHLQRCRVGLPDLNRNGVRLRCLRLQRRRPLLFCRRLRRILNVLPKIAQDLRRTLDQATARCARLQGSDFLANVVLVPGEACPELIDLASDDEPECKDSQESENHDGDHRGGSREAAPTERGDERRKSEAKKPCERERHKDVAPKVEGSDNDHRGD